MKAFLQRAIHFSFGGLSRNKTDIWHNDSIIREELFSMERLVQHAASLAVAQNISAGSRTSRALNARLADNEAVLLAAYRALADVVGKGDAITPAGEWLIDNYHLVEQQIRQIHEDLPPRFYKQLPKLASGPFTGYPRVFGIAWAYVAHSDSRFDPETLRSFVRAYQQVQPLTIGELWAIAITLRVVLVENLRRAAQSIVRSRVAREVADEAADRLLGVNGFDADPSALMDSYRSDNAFSDAFVVQLVKRLRDQDPRVTPALLWLENQLLQQGTTSDEMVRDEHHRQGASNVTIRNIITSMRLISDVNWPEFFESVSLVDEVLHTSENAGVSFAEMDFATRNLYRSAIEELVRGSTHTELEVAHAVIARTRQQCSDPTKTSSDLRERDPGYHLLARGRQAFERSLGYRAPLRYWSSRFNARIGLTGYIATVLVLTLLVLCIPAYALHTMGLTGVQLLWLCAAGAVAATDLALAIVNRVVTREVSATALPALALQDGIPAHLKTMVVVPVLLTTPASIEEQIDRLEVHFLASAQGEVHFALLSDWIDAASEHLADDNALLSIARNGIERLNRAHGLDTQEQRFHLFHRRRVWSEGQQCWMGWERKRGKLHELNRLLRGANDTTFLSMDNQTPLPPSNVRYVITLDADTRLPRETVRRLVGKLAHPLNQARFDQRAGRVVEGYAVLQPRVTPSLPIGREGSLFQRVFSSMNGIDAYDAAVSDVYQDLFGEGSYAGKGIYDIDAFEAALSGRVPEGSLLSHDLFEGCFARAGLVSDIEVVEEFPARYDVAAARTHRWARGDWQLLPWILGRRDVARRGVDALTPIAMWKMLDNLRRTLSAPTIVVALLVGWLLSPRAALLWTLFMFATIVLPALVPVFGVILPGRRGITARSHWRAFSHDLGLAVLQVVFSVTLMAHQAWLMIDAIGRTLFRLIITHRNLLEWTTAAQTQLNARLGLAAIYRRMITSVVIALICWLVVLWQGHGAWWVALPFVALWLAAPAIARRISVSPLVAGHVAVSNEDAQELRLIARRTWRYFETFVTADDNMLPPDNFQEDPQPVVAHRTSPTNLGLYLLCAVSARDFGWAGTVEVVERLEATLGVMRGLQRFRGHFYNWYDTRDLRPLDPRYVSSVDSGNLAAHLIAVANACREWRELAASNAVMEVVIAGGEDALYLTQAALQRLPEQPHLQTITRRQLDDALDVLSNALRSLAANGAASSIIKLRELSVLAATAVDSAQALVHEQASGATRDAHDDLLFWVEATQRSIQSWLRDLGQTAEFKQQLTARLQALESDTRAMAMAMEFDFLLDLERKLLSIGYLATEGTLDSSCYDLLASEARLASFFAIAKNDVMTRHWFRLGRAVTAIGHGAALISWSGSMFEYLMPSLIMRAPAGSLLQQTNHLIVKRQIHYGMAMHVPWGISESAYSARDLAFTYQYSNFGVPGLGLKRGLSENLVVAPYATALAAMVDPAAAARNFQRLTKLEALGRYGFYEALDYTSSRLPAAASFVMVRAFMAHHQGMSIVAISNVLFDGRMRARFHAEPSIRATELLLQERTPRDVSVAHPRAEEVNTAASLSSTQQPEIRRLHTPHTVTPQTHLLSNGRYSVMLTGAGSGYSRWRDLSVSRWREDITRDDMGSYIFLRDVHDGRVWSAGYQPSGVEADSYQATFTEDRAEFIRSDGELTTTLHVVVSPEDDAEVRRVSIVNGHETTRDIDVTSYCELVLAPQAADVAHPAFSKLFVQTEHIANPNALLATRRRRAAHEAEVWAVHHAVVEGEVLGEPEHETDRAAFIGRLHEINEPVAIMDGRPLSNSVGTVLDPIFALRYRVRVAPGATVRVAFWTGVASTRAAALELIDKHHEANAYARAATLAWTQAQVQLHHLDARPEEANLFQQVASHVLYANAAMRPASEAIQRGGGAQSTLWAHGISGDVPIVLLRINHLDDVNIARQLLRAHEYWRLKQLAVDLVILNERASSYVQDLQVALETLVRTSQSRTPILGAETTQGTVFVLRTDLISNEARERLSAVARVVFVGQRGTLSEQLERRAELQRSVVPELRIAKAGSQTSARAALPTELEFANGLGGFADDGREYRVVLNAGQATPMPWINVIANSQFGFQIAAEGGGYTWSVNSREHQLTQWSNDPVTDRQGEILYVRDEESNALWCATAAPMLDESSPYYVRHGQGYSRFEHEAHGIALELLVYVPLNESIKICRLKIRNTSKRRRHLSVTAYVEWVLGTTRGTTAPFIVSEIDSLTGAMFARNPWSATFGTRVAFADMAGQQTHWTADRREFLGRHGRLDRPAAMLSDLPLSNRIGAGLDPCCALQSPIVLERDATTEVVFFLGEAASTEEAQAILKRYRAADLDLVLNEVSEYWDAVLGTVQVKTPDRAMDILLNRWLLYQTLVCRTWARSAFYQASGAYGFRDQLQDGMALAIAAPAITRQHLLRAAGRQFVEGDVQHWWLPPLGQGVRTHISDDRVWLAYAVTHYVKVTGDVAILDEKVPFIEGPLLQISEHDAFFQPGIGEEAVTLFEHCARGLDSSLAVGTHGLPLMGTGDWNDGMNRVGEQGRGESVWLGWFLHSALSSFAMVATSRREQLRVTNWLRHAAALKQALEVQAWDGAWYRRGYFDDGTPLGSISNDECRIDSIAQSWSVISNAGDRAHAAQAMQSLDEQLIQRNVDMALLFTPPFDRTSLEPGYVKGYPPGLRENGGQYTHAATWSVIAFAMLGDGNKAAELFALLNPINHSDTRTGMRRYKVEPYVMAADVYSSPAHMGRGGWTWYTGAAGWMYRAALESILGFQLRGDHLELAPCIPTHWPRVEIIFKFKSTRYELQIENLNAVSSGVAQILLDGTLLPAGVTSIALVDDGVGHRVQVTLG